ncbi:MAG: hypothetical protein KDA29_14895 [Phycisphaerales bacterium]|nr:hypothetical protein [Phycisphaerales bacterium]
MSESMRPSEFLDNFVIPALWPQLDAAFPEFGWKRKGSKWVATIDPGGVFGVRPDRIACLARSPYYITVVDDEGMTWTAYLNGGQLPRGDAFKPIVKQLADLARVDASILDARELSPAEKRQIEERREAARQQAEMQQREDEKHQANEDAKAIAYARELIDRAYLHGDRDPANRYFTRRGSDPETLPGGMLPASIMYVPDCRVSREKIGAVLAIAIDDRFEVVGAQRIFIENSGEPIEVEIQGKKTRKAGIGRLDGAAVVLGEPKHNEPIVFCEGVETGVAIYKLTGWCVLACISAGGLEQVSLDLVRAHLVRSCGVLIVAGDLDRNKVNAHGRQVGMRGQRAAVVAADRFRAELKAPTAELLPAHRWTPQLVGEDEMPIEGKSVDWEDCINPYPDASAAAFGWALEHATLSLTAPAPADAPAEPAEDEKTPEDEAELPDVIQDTRKWSPYGAGVYPKNQLLAAHEFLLARYAPEEYERGQGGLTLVEFAGRVHEHRDGMWVALDAKPLDHIRAKVQRHYLPFCKAVATKETPPRFHYVDANLSMSECNSVAQAALDEVRITLPENDFRYQVWLRPNIDNDGKIAMVDASDRIIYDPHEHGLPDPDDVIPTRGGIIDTQAWRRDRKLVVLPNTPLLFNLGCIEATLPVDEINQVLEGGLGDLEEYAYSLCPEWGEFLMRSFKTNSEATTHGVIREFHKVMGNWISGDTRHQNTNIVWWIGPSGSGKGVKSQVIKRLMPTETVSSSTAKLEQQFHLASWIGKKLAIFPDMEFGRQDKRSILELWKMISGQDSVSIDRKYLSEIPDHTLRTRMLIVANNMPSIPDPTNAIARRSIAFEMPHAVPESQQDIGLVDRLTTPESLAGILLLSLIGILHIDEDGGFTQPECYKPLIDDLRAQASEYNEFIGEYLVFDREGEEPGKAYEDDIWALWSKYREQNGVQANPKKTAWLSQFKTVMTGYGWSQRVAILDEDRKQRYYLGFRISQEGLQLIQAESGAAAGGHDPIFV